MNFVMSVYLSFRPHKNLGSQWTDIDEIWYLNIFRKSDGKKFKFNPLKTKRGPLYLKTQFVPRSKHFSYRLLKPISLCCKWHKSLFVLRQIQNT